MNKQQAAVAPAATAPVAFFQLTKVDEEKRLVYGRAVQEVPDRVGEVLDYESSKPLFEAWSKSQREASLGKSEGNVRSMHKTDSAAGIVVPGGLVFNDVEKAIDITTHVVDDQDWKKVLSGTYTGFSVGGSYLKKWADGNKTRYTAQPSEISLVDRPCIPTAKFFDIQKADGTVLHKNFALTDEEAALAKAFPKDAKKGDKHTVDGKDYEHDGEDWKECAAKVDAPTTVETALEKRAAEVQSQARELTLGQLRKGLLDAGVSEAALDAMTADAMVDAYAVELLKLEAEDLAKGAVEVDVPGTEAEVNEFLKVLATHKLAFKDAVNMVKGLVERKPELLGGAYGELLVRKAEPALAAAPSPEDVTRAIEALVVEKRAVLLTGDTKALTTEQEAELRKEATRAVLLKNFSTCAEFAQLLDGLARLAKRSEYEALIEQDASPLPGALKAWVTEGGALLSKMALETMKETGSGTEALNVPMALSDAAKELVKAVRDYKPDTLSKADAGSSSEVLQKVATLETENAELRKVVDETMPVLKKLQADIDLLKAQPVGGIRLRAVGKSDDLDYSNDPLKKVEPVKDGLGQPQDAATLIKAAHQMGGQPLHLPLAK